MGERNACPLWLPEKVNIVCRHYTAFFLTKIKYGPEQSKQSVELYCYAAVTNYLHWIKNRCAKAS